MPHHTQPAAHLDALPIGTTVLAWPGTRESRPLVTRTRSQVWALGSGTRVVRVEGLSGGIALTHVDVLHPATENVGAQQALRDYVTDLEAWRDEAEANDEACEVDINILIEDLAAIADPNPADPNPADDAGDGPVEQSI